MPRQFGPISRMRLAELLADLLFQFSAGGPALTKSCRNNHHRFHPGIHTFANDARNRGCWGGDNRQVYFLRNLADRRIGLEATDLGMTRVDRVEFSFKCRMPEVLRMVCPTAPGRGVAPITATEAGRKKVSSAVFDVCSG